MTDNPFMRVRVQHLRTSKQPKPQAELIAECAAGHAAYMWAFRDDDHFDRNYFPCFCGVHKDRRKPKPDENPRAVGQLYGQIKDKPAPSKCLRDKCEVHPKPPMDDQARDAAFCAMAHKNYCDAFGDLPGFDPNDLACVCGLHKERLGE